ncbi:MAG: histidinol-phosphatase [Rikenellaceae bacterium]
MRRCNYHTHTTRCQHAVGGDEEYIQSAIAGGYSTLGFSDHTPWPFKDGYDSFMRMGLDEVDSYITTIRELAERYKGEIDIFVGLECEYYLGYIDWLVEQRERLNLDYMLFGNHFPYEENRELYFGEVSCSSKLDIYLESSRMALESGIYDCFAHPDIFMRSLTQVDDFTLEVFKELIEVCLKKGVVMEFNTSIPYHQELWQEVAKSGVDVIIGIDAHDHKILRNKDIYSKAIERLTSLGITPLERLTR